MNTPTPTPRTDAAWSSSFDGEQMSAGQTARALRECSQKLESELAALRAELATERARLDAGQILIKMPSERVWVCGVDLRAAIDAGMQEGAK